VVLYFKKKKKKKKKRQISCRFVEIELAMLYRNKLHNTLLALHKYGQNVTENIQKSPSIEDDFLHLFRKLIEKIN